MKKNLPAGESHILLFVIFGFTDCAVKPVILENLFSNGSCYSMAREVLSGRLKRAGRHSSCPAGPHWIVRSPASLPD